MVPLLLCLKPMRIAPFFLSFFRFTRNGKHLGSQELPIVQTPWAQLIKLPYKMVLK